MGLLKTIASIGGLAVGGPLGALAGSTIAGRLEANTLAGKSTNVVNRPGNPFLAQARTYLGMSSKAMRMDDASLAIVTVAGRPWSEWDVRAAFEDGFSAVAIAKAGKHVGFSPRAKRVLRKLYELEMALVRKLQQEGR